MNSSDIEPNFQEEGNPDGYVVVCKHIASKSRPILVIEMDIPYDERHSGWEAICNAEGDDCDVEDFVEWPMEKLLEYEPSLRELLKNPRGLPMIHRDTKDSPWKIIE